MFLHQLDRQSLKHSFLCSKSSSPKGRHKKNMCPKNYLDKSSDLPRSPINYPSKETRIRPPPPPQQQQQLATLLKVVLSTQVTHGEHLFTIHILCQMAMRSWQLGWQRKKSSNQENSSIGSKDNITTISPSLLLYTFLKTKTVTIYLSQNQNPYDPCML